MDLMQVFSKFVEVFLMAAAPVAAVFVVGVLKRYFDLLLTRLEAERPNEFAVVKEVAGWAVAAAEQSGLAGLVKDKKEFALNLAMNWLAERDIVIDLAMLDAAIEAAVWEVINAPKKA